MCQAPGDRLNVCRFANYAVKNCRSIIVGEIVAERLLLIFISTKSQMGRRFDVHCSAKNFTGLTTPAQCIVGAWERDRCEMGLIVESPAGVSVVTTQLHAVPGPHRHAIYSSYFLPCFMISTSH